ncbi:MAG: cob(I)yrinic acid a,c-diamide adenosyltransferase [Nitrospirae bacterium]|nr:cob(I)yrinic acid a,c-diamide adenosyltransferase [Candidatus Manganitrophaceae bacterium]
MSERRGLIIVNTGDGKGKTTAALGLAMRAVGGGLKVIMIQFIKGLWQTGEQVSAKTLGFELRPMGEGFTWITQDRERDIAKAEAAWEYGKTCLFSGNYDLVILDEINIALDYDYLNLSDVLETLENRPKDLHVALTGRRAKAELLEIADLATEMREIKHPFKQGIKAQKGIEF